MCLPPAHHNHTIESEETIIDDHPRLVCARVARKFGMAILTDDLNFDRVVDLAVENVKKLKVNINNVDGDDRVALCLVVREFFKLAPERIYVTKIEGAVSNASRSVRAAVAAAVELCAAPDDATKVTLSILDLDRWNLKLPGESKYEPFLCMRYVMAALKAQEKGYEMAGRTVPDLLREALGNN